jgi:prepilin-type N-terminal cleavage/methylation domain-containing protein
LKSSAIHFRSAFSLVEVMCAIAILAVALVGLTQGITTALSSSKESELQTVAALLAAGRIETLRAEGYFYDGVEEGQCSEDLAQYQWKQTITSTSTVGLHEVEVVVENARTGQPIYELRTLLFDPADLQTAAAQAANQKNSDRSKRKEGRER